jgi:hypothetical protein
VGETHRDHRTIFDRKNHEIRKIINHGPRMPKWAPRRHQRVPPGHPIGPADPPPRPSRHVSSKVRFEPNTLQFHMFRLLFRTELKITCEDILKETGKIISVITEE